MTARQHAAKIVQLDAARKARAHRTSGQDRQAKLDASIRRLQRDVALMQGYSELLMHASPEQQTLVLQTIARKGRELSDSLVPILAQRKTGERPTLEQYRDTRVRTRQLIAEFRLTLNRIRATANARQGVL